MRNLQADLEICGKATWGDWEALYGDTESNVVFTHIKDGKRLHGDICVVDGGCNHENDAHFIAAAREGWPEAIRRAMEAEKNNGYLQQEIDKTYKLLSNTNLSLMRLESETGIQKIIIPGRPITKKNHQQISKHSGIIQSEAYQIYETASLWELKKYRVRYTGKVSLCARYWMPNRASWPDLIGLLQATSDILQKAGIIENDKLVVSYDGSRIVGIDKQNPRVEIEIEEGG